MKRYFSLCVLAFSSLHSSAVWAEGDDFVTSQEGNHRVIVNDGAGIMQTEEQGDEVRTPRSRRAARAVAEEPPVAQVPPGWDSLTDGTANGGGVLDGSGGTMIGRAADAMDAARYYQNQGVQTGNYGVPVGAGYPYQGGVASGSGSVLGAVTNLLQGRPQGGVSAGQPAAVQVPSGWNSLSDGSSGGGGILDGNSNAIANLRNVSVNVAGTLANRGVSVQTYNGMPVEAEFQTTAREQAMYGALLSAMLNYIWSQPDNAAGSINAPFASSHPYAGSYNAAAGAHVAARAGVPVVHGTGCTNARAVAGQAVSASCR